MKKLNLIKLSHSELTKINGGGVLRNIFKATFEVVHTAVKYSSPAGAFLTGVVEGSGLYDVVTGNN